jgi:hypothetical protein
VARARGLGKVTGHPCVVNELLRDLHGRLVATRGVGLSWWPDIIEIGLYGG